MVWCLCPDQPPDEVKSKGAKGVQQGILLSFKDEPHQFALGLKDACCTEPCCCILSACGAPCGFTACYAREAVLNKYHNGINDFVCCQGYIPQCCCCNPSTWCKGSTLGLYCEGCCCPVFSLSIARIHLMQSKRIRPDPQDWQIIHCSNVLQLLSCIFDIVAIFVEQAREAAHIVDLIADCFTLSVAGCMGAQVYHEIKKDKDGVRAVTVARCGRQPSRAHPTRKVSLRALLAASRALLAASRARPPRCLRSSSSSSRAYLSASPPSWRAPSAA